MGTAAQITDCVELIFKDPQAYSARPRYTHLRFGLACLTVAALLALSQASLAWWKPSVLGDIRFSYGLLLVAGWLSTVRALRHDLFMVHRATLDRSGLTLHWSHVPRLIGQRTAHESRIDWQDVRSGEWLESEHDVDRRQYLDLTLAGTLGEGRRHLRLPVCDQRLLEPCRALAMVLPDHIASPVWLRRERFDATDTCSTTVKPTPHPALDTPIL